MYHVCGNKIIVIVIIVADTLVKRITHGMTTQYGTTGLPRRRISTKKILHKENLQVPVASPVEKWYNMI